MRRELQAVRTGQIVGAVVVDEAGPSFEGRAGEVLAAMRGRLGDLGAAELVMAEGWSNGYLYFADPDPEEAIVAAAAAHTGAMVALIPSQADAARLAVDGGEPADQLHVTLAYLGEAAAIGPDARAAIIGRLQAVVEDAVRPDYAMPIGADGFALSLFNPTDNQRDTCIVLGLSGADLDAIHGMVHDSLSEVESSPAGFTMPEQHQPFIPHLTLIYTDDAAQLAELVDRTGPVLFDRLRVAFAGDTTDIPLEAAMTTPVILPAAADMASGGPMPMPMPDYANTARWEAVLTVEGIESGDGREFATDALTWDTPPLPLMWQNVSSHGSGYDEAVGVGRIDKVWRDGSNIMGRGVIDLDNPDGAELHRQVAAGFVRGNSVDVDSVKDADIELVYPEDQGGADSLDDDDEFGFEDLFGPPPDKVVFHKGRIRGTTVVQYPAFVEAQFYLIDEQGNRLDPLTAGAVGPHGGATSAGSWDGPANEKRLPSPMPVATARAAYAWIDDGAVADGELPKTGARFIHHEVSSSGDPGAANTTACSTGIGVLNGGRGGTTIPGGDVQGVYDHLAGHLRDAGLEPPPLQAEGDTMTAAAYTITIPDLPPAWWFDEPTQEPEIGALTITDEGRLFGWLAPGGVSHRAFRGQRAVFAPRNQDYSEFMNKTAIVEDADGQPLRLAAGNITMACEHAPAFDPRRADPNWAAQHYEDSCSIFARVRVGESASGGTWVAGALLPDVTWAQVTRALGCALSGDWQGGKMKAALLVPVEGFPKAHHASVRVTDGVLVSSAVPVRFRRTAPAAVDLRPVLEAMARRIGRDTLSRLNALRERHPARRTTP